MADIFMVGELEECEDDNESDICTPSEVHVIIEESDESQSLLNNNSDGMTVLEENSTSLDSPVKQETDDSELDAQDELSGNPDDLLPPIDKLEKYANSEHIFNRQLVARNLSDTLRLVSAHENEVSRAFMVLGSLWDDFDPTIRAELMAHFPHIAAFCKETNFNHAIEQHLLPVIMCYLDDDNFQVRKVCHSSLLSMVEQKLIDDDLVTERICPLIVHLTDSSQPEELRMENILLISKMIVLLGTSIAQKLYFEKFFDLCQDRSNNIRKACASTFGDICTSVGTQITEEELLSKFCVLCEDLAWCVRKACVDNFMPVSCIVRPQTRSRPLANLYMILLNDQSRWVRLAAYQALGPFISTFANPTKTGLIYIRDSIIYSTSLLSDLEEESAISHRDTPTKQAASSESKDKAPEVKCNGDINVCVSLDEYCRTPSDLNEGGEVPCLRTNCASDIPGITCHVGSYSTVIGMNGNSCDQNNCDMLHKDCDPTDRLTEEPTAESNGSRSDREFNQLWGEITDWHYDDSNCDSVSNNNHSEDMFDSGGGCSSRDQQQGSRDQQAEESETCNVIRPKLNGEVHCDDSAFNHFQYWRSPLPEVDLTVDLRFPSICFDRQPTDQQNRFEKRNSEWPQNVILEFSEDEPPEFPHMSPYDQDIVPPELLLQYLNMIDTSWAQTIDAEIARHCAYSLPAVALTLGRKFWLCLKDAFDTLCSDLQGMMWKVRRTVAFAMHRLAVILGPEITSSDLLPVFSRFITDLDEVRIGVLQHLYDFLKVLRPAERKQFLPSLPEFLIPSSEADSHEKNWRFRHILAEQLVSVTHLYDPHEVCEHLVPLTLILIRDKVCEVRMAAVRVMAAVIRQMNTSPTKTYTKKVMSELTEKFVHSSKWRHRQLYVYTCQEVIAEDSLPPEQFAEDALPQLLYLSWDRVPNVRIAISRCLATVLWPREIFSGPKSSNRELLLETIHTLQSDADSDVRFYANMVSAHECSCLQNGEFQDMTEPFM